MKVLVTGASGFLMGYTVERLLKEGFQVVGLDNYSKYGKIKKSYDQHPNYKFYEHDAGDIVYLTALLKDCDHFIAAAAMIGGIAYFHELAYDLIEENNRLIGAAFRSAINSRKAGGKLKKVTVISSSMVYENTTIFPTPEAAVISSTAPSSTYGMQKLCCEYYAKGALDQYSLPYTILRPFNIVGIGESKALCDKEIQSGNIKLALSHVIPDLVHKALKKQNPMHLLGDGTQVRHYTYGGDLAEGVLVSLTHPRALNEDFNISTAQKHTVKEVAKLIWYKTGHRDELLFEHDPPFKYDVPFRSPSINKAKTWLGFEAKTPLHIALDEVIPWVKQQIDLGKL